MHAILVNNQKFKAFIPSFSDNIFRTECVKYMCKWSINDDDDDIPDKCDSAHYYNTLRIVTYFFTTITIIVVTKCVGWDIISINHNNFDKKQQQKDKCHTNCYFWCLNHCAHEVRQLLEEKRVIQDFHK